MRRHITVLLLVFVLGASACSDDADDDDGGGDAPAGAPETDDERSSDTGVPAAVNEPGPLSVSLSQGEGETPDATPVATVDGEPLDPDAVETVLDRLPAWEVDDDDRSEFERPAESIAPPRTGETIDVPFPAEGQDPPPEVHDGPLEVLRVQPEGAVGLAPFVSVTFDQPMVALGTVEQTDASDVPVELTPEVPGRWQWIGTRTLRFEHDPDLFDRLPMATGYVIEIPAGTESATGNELAETVRVEFETPTPSVRWFAPQGESLPLEPVFLAVFDQRVDPESVLDVTTLRAGDSSVPVRLATDDEIAADEDTKRRVDEAVEGTWVAFRPVDALAPDTALTVEIGPQIPSAEGPATNDEVHRYEARTYAPLRIDRQDCPEADPCQPEWGFGVSFNNELDTEASDLDGITVEPALPGARIRIQGNGIRVEGDADGSTIYTMSVPAGLTDVFGQTLGEATTIDFHIAAAHPFLGRQDEETPLVTLDPLVESQTLPLEIRNHDELRVRAYAVAPSDWGAFRLWWETRWIEGGLPEPQWTELYDETVATGAPRDERFEARIDLDPVFAGGPGMAVVLIEPVGELADLSENDERWWQNRPVAAWVQSTHLGVDVLRDADEGVVWVTDLRTGVPVEGAEIRTGGDEEPLATDADGLVRFGLPPQSVDAPLVATLDDDRALLPDAVGSAWTRDDPTIWYVADDRGIYRPGETMRVKGWVRELDLAAGAELSHLPAGEAITWTARDSFGNDVDSGEVIPDVIGGFDFAVELPAGANLGEAWIEFVRPGSAGSGGHTHQFRIDEFRRPEFEVAARAETAGPYLVDEPATVAVDAIYFSGGPLPDAPVDWTVTTTPSQYSPPGWDEFTFGIWRPWWIEDFRSGGDFGFRGNGIGFPQEESSRESFAGITDADGSHFLRMDFAGDGEGRPTTVTASANVTDVNRQTWGAATDLLVHPGELYVGLRATRTFVREGEPLDVEAIVTGIDGEVVADRELTIVAERLVDEYADGEWTEVAVDREECSVTSTTEAVACEFAVPHGGQWRISAGVVDDAGRESRSEMVRWVTGDDAVPSRRLELQQATLVPDAEEYAVGDTAELFVASPFGPAHGLMTVTREGIVTTETFEITGSDTVLEIPIVDDHVPGIGVDIELVGITDRAADDGTVLPDVPPRPAFAAGSVTLRVPPVSRTLTVEAVPDDEVAAPGTQTVVAVEVTDAGGDPVEGAHMMVVAVDEAVLALTGYELLDPLEVFYRTSDEFGAGGLVQTSRGRGAIRLADPAALAALEQELRDELAQTPSTTVVPSEGGLATGRESEESADTAAADDASAPVPADFNRTRAEGEGSSPAIGERTNFDALAVWQPDVVTDESGQAMVDIDLPDNLTRYRVMVVAVDGVDRFGSTESSITARLPLQVRPSAPRFLNFGDDFELPIVVQNLTDEAVEVDVVVQGANLEIVGAPGRSVTVPADDRVEVRFPARTESAGTARFRAAVVSADHADASTVSLPVYTPATAEAFATYGTVDAGAVVQPVQAPDGVIEQFGGLEVSTSSTALQALTDAILYLTDYEYRSSDAYASRILAIAALRDVLEAFEAEGLPGPDELDAVVAGDISGLAALQNSDGGFGSWFRDERSSPFRSVQALHALVEAEANGYAVPGETLASGRSYLRNIENLIPSDWTQATRDSVIAYALHVRRLDDDADPGAARALWERSGTELELDALAWLWPVVEDAAIEAEIARTFSNRVTETPAAATFATDYGEDAHLLLHSDRRTDGIVLDAFIEMDPGSDLIPKIVAGLIGNQRQGRWSNVQENSFILLALNRYFDTFEAATPDFVARVWLGDLHAAEHTFAGRAIDTNETVVPMGELLERGDSDLVVGKEGEGRLYYRLGLRYAPDDFDLDPLDRGFVVQRRFEAVDDPDDVRLADDGTWRVRAGAEVRVRLTMVNDSRRVNMALVDPLPAGLEPLNPDLAVTGDIPPDEQIEESGFGVPEGDVAADVAAPSFRVADSSWWRGPWYDHQNLRDDRVEAFSAWLEAGTHEYSYVARATTPGTFVVPPTRAEEIYAPEVFGRSGSDVLMVEE